MPRVYREKFRAYGMRAGHENVEILRFLTVTLALIFVGMLLTLVTFLTQA